MCLGGRRRLPVLWIVFGILALPFVSFLLGAAWHLAVFGSAPQYDDFFAREVWIDSVCRKYRDVPGTSRGQAQVSPFTQYDRYPDIFSFVSRQFAADLDRGKEERSDKSKNEKSKAKKSFFVEKREEFEEERPPCRILSFGCSEGQETKALRELYFPRCVIDGVDTNPAMICRNQMRAAASGDSLTHFYVADRFPPGEYDVVFAMSVLCQHFSPQTSNLKKDEESKHKFVWNGPRVLPEGIGKTKNPAEIIAQQPEFRAGPLDIEIYDDLIALIDSRVKVGGYLVIYNSNYLFTESPLFADGHYVVVDTRDVWETAGFVPMFARNGKTKVQPSEFFSWMYQKVK